MARRDRQIVIEGPVVLRILKDLGKAPMMPAEPGDQGESMAPSQGSSTEEEIGWGHCDYAFVRKLAVYDIFFDSF
jgi:hypothetical protein